MPFDTTFNIVYPNYPTVIITTPGGKDTIINVQKDDLPGFIISHPEMTETLYQYEQKYIKPGVEVESSHPFLWIEILLVLFLIFLGFSIKQHLPVWKKAIKKVNSSQIVIIIFALACTPLFFMGYTEFGWAALLFTAIVAGEFKKEIFYPNRIVVNNDEFSIVQNTIKKNQKPVLMYAGSELYFSDEEITTVLTKRFPYFAAISNANKERFIYRLKKFIKQKVFHIHAESGFKEMPILISAAAIQLTFGLEKYLLPYFKNIHVYPEEFFRANDMGICFLAGNVSGNNINLSWKHFLHGYEHSIDGQNVGLHELAHALYYQAIVVEQGVDDDFSDSYNDFANHGNKVYDIEMNPTGGLYTQYANKNFQEFWAESAEIFFERAEELKNLYPQLYQTLIELFNQDPLNLQNIPLS